MLTYAQMRGVNLVSVPELAGGEGRWAESEAEVGARMAHIGQVSRGRGYCISVRVCMGSRAAGVRRAAYRCMIASLTLALALACLAVSVGPALYGGEIRGKGCTCTCTCTRTDRGSALDCGQEMSSEG